MSYISYFTLYLFDNEQAEHYAAKMQWNEQELDQLYQFIFEHMQQDAMSDFGMFFAMKDNFNDFKIFNQFNTNSKYKSMNCNEPCKGYDLYKHMLELSKHFPNKLFIVRRGGSFPGDLCKNYFYNGKQQNVPAKIRYDKFDLTKI